MSRLLLAAALLAGVWYASGQRMPALGGHASGHATAFSGGGSLNPVMGGAAGSAVGGAAVGLAAKAGG